MVIAKFVIGFVILAILFWVLETLWPEKREQGKWRPETKSDIGYWFLNGLVTRTVISLVLLVAVVMTSAAIPRPAASLIGRQPRWFQVIEVLLLGDLIFYWVHRLTHSIPILWRFHAVHHSPRELDWLASARVHPLDSIFTRVLSSAPLYIVGFPANVLAGYAPFLAVYPILLHANVSWSFGKLGYIFASPAFHRWHHAADIEALDKNFSGAFPFFDYFFGTAYFSPRRRPASYGLLSQNMPKGLFAQLAYPFRNPTRGRKSVRLDLPSKI